MLLLTLEECDPTYISQPSFGVFTLLSAAFAFGLALVLALAEGVVLPTAADEAWAIASRRPLSEDEVAFDDSIVISLDRSMCFGWCPDYSLRLYGTGKVEYVGKYFVCAFGEHTATADPREVRRLVEAMRAAGFVGLSWRPGPLATDSPTVVASLGREGHEFRVRHYHGDYGAPRWLALMEDEIDRVAGTARWLPIPGDDRLLSCNSSDGQPRPVTMEPPLTGGHD